MVNLIVNQLIMKAPIHLLDKEQLHVSAEWVPNHLLVWNQTSSQLKSIRGNQRHYSWQQALSYGELAKRQCGRTNKTARIDQSIP